MSDLTDYLKMREAIMKIHHEELRVHTCLQAPDEIGGCLSKQEILDQCEKDIQNLRLILLRPRGNPTADGMSRPRTGEGPAPELRQRDKGSDNSKNEKSDSSYSSGVDLPEYQDDTLDDSSLACSGGNLTLDCVSKREPSENAISEEEPEPNEESTEALDLFLTKLRKSVLPDITTVGVKAQEDRLKRHKVKLNSTNVGDQINMADMPTCSSSSVPIDSKVSCEELSKSGSSAVQCSEGTDSGCYDDQFAENEQSNECENNSTHCTDETADNTQVDASEIDRVARSNDADDSNGNSDAEM